MSKTALVVSGGGSKGAFAVGVIKHLRDSRPDIEFDIFVGTSTGSLIVPLVAADNIPLLEKLYTTVRKKDIILEGNLIERFRFSMSLYDSQPLANLIMQYINDDNCKKIIDSNKEVYIATTCLQTGGIVVWSTKPPTAETDYTIKQVKNFSELRRAVLASSNQPVFMQPIAVRPEDRPLRQYVDGGVRDYLGIQTAIDAGAEEIYAISLASLAEAPIEMEYKNVFPILQRTIDIFSEDVGWNDIKVPRVYNHGLRYIAAVKNKMKDAGIPQNEIDNYFTVPLFPSYSGKKPIKIHHIAPKTPLGGGPGGLNFDPQEMTAMLNKGKTQMQEYLTGLPQQPDGNV